MITGLYTIWCQVSDMEASVAFYRDVLGLKLSYSSPHWSQFDLGNGQLGLHPRLAESSGPLGQYASGWMLGLSTNDLKGLRAKLEAAGAQFHGDYHAIPGGLVLDFSDPDGNQIEAGQMGITVEDLQ